jgi:hypothetical protein
MAQKEMNTDFDLAVFHNNLIHELSNAVMYDESLFSIDDKMQVNINRRIRWTIILSVRKLFEEKEANES